MMKQVVPLMLLLPVAHAWTFLYTNSTDKSTILHEDKTRNCTKIDLASGKHFSWDPEGDNLCISIYYDDSCNSRGGISCPAWSKNASTDFSAVEIFTDKEAASASISKEPATSTATTSTATSSSPTSATTTSNAGSDSASTSSSVPEKTTSSAGISGGAIAGIVIGAVAGVLIIAAAFFFFGKRHRKSAAANQQLEPGPYGPNQSNFGDSTFDPSSPSGTMEKPPLSAGDSGFRVPAGSRPPAELPGHQHTAELAHSPLSEMDGHSTAKTFFGQS